MHTAFFSYYIRYSHNKKFNILSTYVDKYEKWLNIINSFIKLFFNF